ncbi:MAG TPA: bifunctional phosphoribosylaminoimidazolecarboxamide formyltransferase/IMP cyclohydrolase [Acidimicrobiales bacterium]|nr:bifunctional phosphoribosylaminoimidazolecarboxamide formyltransferase/IMP cyclohydrolase [Acidimicrobiales bacterium]
MRALLSVYDKTGLIDLANELSVLGVEIISSGGTSIALGAAGVQHLEVADVTGAPEMLGGRVKTLHPRIHGGILADRSKAEHLSDIEQQGIDLIDLVVCNLYPFTSDPSIEMIDVGGPTMVRAAAKNHDHVGVVVDPADYPLVIDELRVNGELSPTTRRSLARKAFAHTSEYDRAIVTWFDGHGTPEGERGDEALPDRFDISLERAGELRYGENPHQYGARYRFVDAPRGFWDFVTQHGGRELSYLNLFDGEAAWRLAYELLELNGTANATVIVKHANPCGVAIGDDLLATYQRAFDADPLSAFGGIVALTGEVDLEIATVMVSNPLADVLIAPNITEDALALFARKRKNMRPLVAPRPMDEPLAFRQIAGGFLVQNSDRFVASRTDFEVVTSRQPSDSEWLDLELAWRVCGRTTSNAIVLARDGQVVGIGCGQQNRVDAAGLAAKKASGRAVGGAGASDAFFPFRDGLDAIADAGVAVVVQPGGSLRDKDIIQAADERNIAMVLTGERHFRH